MTPKSIQEAAERAAAQVERQLGGLNGWPATTRQRVTRIIAAEFQPAAVAYGAKEPSEPLLGDGVAERGNLVGNQPGLCGKGSQPQMPTGPGLTGSTPASSTNLDSSAEESVPTPEEAKAILGRFNASHFNLQDQERARYRIPADPKHDDDIRLMAFIKNHERTVAALEKAERERDEAKQSKQIQVEAIAIAGRRITALEAKLKEAGSKCEAYLKNATEELEETNRRLESVDAALRDAMVAKQQAEARAVALQERVTELEEMPSPDGWSGERASVTIEGAPGEFGFIYQVAMPVAEALAASRKQVAELTEELAHAKKLAEENYKAGMKFGNEYVQARITALEAALGEAYKVALAAPELSRAQLNTCDDNICEIHQHMVKIFAILSAALAPYSAVSSPGLAPTDGGQQ